VRRRLRVFLGAFGDPGHAFPMLALGARLVARGHEVALETWARWREPVEAEGIRFLAAPEYPVFPTPERPLKPYEAVVPAAAHTRASLREYGPQLVVHDILTLAPALAGELEDLPVATLIPHLYTAAVPGFPPYAIGARLPRTALGRIGWRGLHRIVDAGLRQGRAELNEARRRLGLAPTARLHGGLSPELCIVGTFPQLEYPRRWPREAHVVGPLLWEPHCEDLPLPDGPEPLVLVAPSTAHDAEQRLLRAALAGLAGAAVQVLGVTAGRTLGGSARVPENARLVEWAPYARTMPRCSLVITHGGHGTLARSLACGCPVLVVPHSGDMGENAARVGWAGAGIRLPWRFLAAAPIRLAVNMALERPRLRQRARELAQWAGRRDGAANAAALVEEWGAQSAR
jgi:UDP:flavonoid glycosyltransferase YjiC (YdhE family)